MQSVQKLEMLLTIPLYLISRKYFNKFLYVHSYMASKRGQYALYKV